MFLILFVRQILQGSDTLKSISSRYRFSIFSSASVSDSLISSIFHNLTLLSDQVSRILALPASFTICSWGTGGRTRKFSLPFTKDNTENVLSTPIISTEYYGEEPPDTIILVSADSKDAIARTSCLWNVPPLT